MDAGGGDFEGIRRALRDDNRSCEGEARASLRLNNPGGTRRGGGP